MEINIKPLKDNDNVKDKTGEKLEFNWIEI